jgi:hypothetical protein
MYTDLNYLFLLIPVDWSLLDHRPLALSENITSPAESQLRSGTGFGYGVSPFSCSRSVQDCPSTHFLTLQTIQKSHTWLRNILSI